MKIELQLVPYPEHSFRTKTTKYLPIHEIQDHDILSQADQKNIPNLYHLLTQQNRITEVCNTQQV